MNTQCPHCRTVFRIGADALAAASGRVRCGQCGTVFDARGRLQRELALEAAAKQEPGAPRTSVPTRQPGLGLEDAASTTTTSVLLSDLDDDQTRRPERTRAALAGWAALNGVLLAALCAQLVLVQRDALAQDPAMRPLIARMCTVVGCQLAPRRAVDRIELVRRNVYAHPNVDDALIIDVQLVNNAPFPQPYPVLSVSLGDLRREALARRNFAPREYRPELDPEARMAPGSPVRVTLEVRDPGPGARTFELDLY